MSSRWPLKLDHCSPFPVQMWPGMILISLFVSNTGELSLDEFVEGARKDEEFMEVMMKSLDLQHIVSMINHRRHSV